jgi:CubicO group peptidase (beta-lactamase class C family)
VEYRNVNYALLGEVVTRVSGIEFSDYIRSNVLKPLGMHADFHLTEDMRPLAATGYIGMWDPMRVVLKLVVPSAARRLYKGRMGTLLELNEYGLSSAAIGGLVGSVLDFSRFLQSQLVGGGSVLSPGSMAKMQTMVAAGQAGVVSREGIGLGWKFGSGRHGRFMNHEGSGAGFASELRLYPDRGVGIALAMNAMRMPKTMRVAHAMCEALVQNFN